MRLFSLTYFNFTKCQTKIHNKQTMSEQKFLSTNKKVQSRQQFLLFWIPSRSFKFFAVTAVKPVNGTCSVYTNAANTSNQN